MLKAACDVRLLRPMSIARWRPSAARFFLCLSAACWPRDDDEANERKNKFRKPSAVGTGYNPENLYKDDSVAQPLALIHQ